MSLIGNIAKDNENDIDVYNKSSSIYTKFQMFLFLIGILLLIVYSSGVKIKSDKNKQEKCIKCISHNERNICEFEKNK
jgi:hypothetical protein